MDKLERSNLKNFCSDFFWVNDVTRKCGSDEKRVCFVGRELSLPPELQWKEKSIKEKNLVKGWLASAFFLFFLVAHRTYLKEYF